MNRRVQYTIQAGNYSRSFWLSGGPIFDGEGTRGPPGTFIGRIQEWGRDQNRDFWNVFKMQFLEKLQIFKRFWVISVRPWPESCDFEQLGGKNGEKCQNFRSLTAGPWERDQKIRGLSPRELKDFSSVSPGRGRVWGHPRKRKTRAWALASWLSKLCLCITSQIFVLFRCVQRFSLFLTLVCWRKEFSKGMFVSCNIMTSSCIT